MSIRNDRTEFFKTLCLPWRHLTPSHSCGSDSKTRETESITQIPRNGKLLGLPSFYSPLHGEIDTFEHFVVEANEGQNRLLPKSNFDPHWTENANVAFNESKQILAKATLLVHPDPSALLNITCDASDFAIGSVLQRCIDNVWQPLSFLSKKQAPAETRYSAFDRELLAVYATIRHLRHNLEGREFFFNTDQKPLTYVINSTTERPSLHQTRHLVFIAEFTPDIRYVKGETNFVADALSRPTVSAIECEAVMSADQALDTEFIRLRHSTLSNMKFRLLKTFDDVLVWYFDRAQQTIQNQKSSQESVYNTSRVRAPFS